MSDHATLNAEVKNETLYSVLRNAVAILDAVGAPSRVVVDSRTDRALSIEERIRALAYERDRATDSLALLRQSHMRTVREATELRAKEEARARADVAGVLCVHGKPPSEVCPPCDAQTVADFSGPQ